jgi:lanosterol synthase
LLSSAKYTPTIVPRILSEVTSPKIDPQTHSRNRRTIQRAIKYLHDAQKPEGGWVGSWGICFTYATQFALESLSLVGETYETSDSSRRACEFLISKQCADGGWGESYKVY